jgi:hypothetical protein
VPDVRHGSAAVLLIVLTGWLTACGDATPPPTATPMSAEEFRRELVNLPLCGTPATGPLAGKAICTVHLADGTATLAGAGIVARLVWTVQGRAICRGDAGAPPDQRQCVTYDRLSNGRYRNSDGVEICLGPCPDPAQR